MVFDQRITGNVSNIINIIKQNSTKLETEINQAKLDTFTQLNSIIEQLRQDVNAKSYSADVYNKDYINLQLDDLRTRIASIQGSSVYLKAYPGAIKFGCQSCGRDGNRECGCQYRTGFAACNSQGCTEVS
ncbi:Hypothetical_protein [Hexamita inflata]|uniref:Hypothetical_protein n=1 Tax=Hexamita inflata TaxID=28002 RepID=A0AA86V1H4_9EUKA|nr:Hypothetical protein HINF_LOCUS60197 [Hexamita inflata]